MSQPGAVAMSRHRIHHNVKEDIGVELFDRQPLERFCQPFQSSLEAERKLNGRKSQETREKLQGATPCLTGWLKEKQTNQKKFPITSI